MTADNAATFRCLTALRDSGWKFSPETNQDGELVEIRGAYEWPGTGSADRLLFRYTTDALAVRTDNTGDVVWQREGGLVEVVEQLMTLPRPGHRLTPRLALGVRAPIPWTPGQPLLPGTVPVRWTPR
ncbi:hypothetical protein [Amycolatopsis minnesotensis]|uniref:Uncharacterized protein n=1 Tax=Amycolatopsis minnesotensis TaxID=337894 RepID=A0ABP5BGN9_9PSEU